MELNSCDVKKAHELLGRPDEIVRQRRVLYRAAIDLFREAGDRLSVDEGVLDNPAVRGHLGAVLAGRSSYEPSHLRPLAELVAPGYATEVEGNAVRLASAPSAPAALASVLDRVAGELQRHGAQDTLSLLTSDARTEIDDAYDCLLHGVRLAVRVAPELVTDLLPHVDLFGVVVSTESARLGSASAREYPGLILIPVPGSPLEVAEALVHEGAHQKFFDFGMTRDILSERSPQASRFTPSWAPPGAPNWPLEQTLAAWHAYHCLAVFDRCRRSESAEKSVLHAESLLPKAADRAAEIGQWLLARGSFLGKDAHTLIGQFEGTRPYDPWPVNEAPSVISLDVADGSQVVLEAAGRTLVARRGAPPELYWFDSVLV